MAKATSPIPPGFHSLTPHLSVDGAAKYIDFLVMAFGATEIHRAPGPGGKLMHALVKIGDSMLMFADLFPEMGSPPIAQGHWPIVLNLYVPRLRYAIASSPEVLDHSFDLSQVEQGSIRLLSPGTGSLGEIPSTQGKASPLLDRDHNGVAEMTIRFGRDDLRRLFDALPGGEHVVVCTIEGTLASGVRFEAPLSLDVFAAGALASSIAPNPMNPDATITFRVTRSGNVRVSLMDVQGRVLGVLHDSPLSPGYHDVRVHASNNGRALASGVYFYTIEAPEGIERGRLVVVK